LKAKNIIWCNFHHDNILYDGETVHICGFSQSRVKVSREYTQAQSILGLRGRFYYNLLLFLLKITNSLKFI
jgi:hypothetical protein